MSAAQRGDGHTSLTPSEAEHFLTKGWLHVPNAIQPQYVDKWMSDLWARIGYDADDKSTWKQEYLHLPRHREVRCEEFCPSAWSKVLDIVGGEAMLDPERERWFGDAFIINLGTEERTKQADQGKFRPEGNYFHVDDDWYRMFLDSSGNALTVILCFTDIPERGGGLLQYLYDHPEGLDPPVDGHTSHIRDCKRFTTVTAKAGDVFLLHGLLPHAVSPNYLHYARVIANPHVSLRAPHTLNRPDGNYTLLEQVILRNLGRPDGIDFVPSRERRSWHPRNAGFKRAYADEELRRMVAAAEAKGLDGSTVDSIYLKRGTEEFAEFERHNGFDREVGEAGLLMEQHTTGFENK